MWLGASPSTLICSGMECEKGGCRSAQSRGKDVAIQREVLAPCHPRPSDPTIEIVDIEARIVPKGGRDRGHRMVIATSIVSFTVSVSAAAGVGVDRKRFARVHVEFLLRQWEVEFGTTCRASAMRFVGKWRLRGVNAPARGTHKGLSDIEEPLEVRDLLTASLAPNAGLTCLNCH